MTTEPARAKECFRLPWLWSSLLALLVLANVSLVIARYWLANHMLPASVAGVSVILLGLAIGLAPIATPAVCVRSDSVTLYHLNRLRWEQIRGVRPVSVLGLPYLVLARRQGLSFWLPLYVCGRRQLQAALAERVPAGNPLAIYLGSLSSNKSFKPNPLRGSA